MSSRKLEDLTSYMEDKVKKLIELAKSNGISIIITSTARTIQEQHALYAQGREKLSVVNNLRKQCGLPNISDKKNKSCVTWTLNSKHIVDYTKNSKDKSKAFDFAILKNGIATWDVKVNLNKNEIPDYIEIGNLGKSLGLVWGGDWKKPDYPHFQQPNNI